MFVLRAAIGAIALLHSTLQFHRIAYAKLSLSKKRRLKRTNPSSAARAAMQNAVALGGGRRRCVLGLLRFLGRCVKGLLLVRSQEGTNLLVGVVADLPGVGL